MIRTLSGLDVAGPLARFRHDLSRRYPAPGGGEPKSEATPPATRIAHRLERLPPEIGTLLIVVGIFGVLLPGPVGSPFLVAGGLALWPSGFRKTEDWLSRVAPGIYEEGLRQLERYLADLERRYPGSTR